MAGKRRRHRRADEQYVNRRNLLVSIYRGLTEREAQRFKRQHGRNAHVSGRSDDRTVTLTEQCTDRHQ